ncbi:MAG: M28 family peptidase [Bacteroidota bacterium]|nr:M28 family peptidase [Bacteroidota bacterium]
MRYAQIIVLLCFVLLSCSSENNFKNNPSKKTVVTIPNFNADSAYHFVKTQVEFGPRALSTEGWRKCALYLEKKLSSYCKNVTVQEAKITTYDKKNHTLKNIIASFSPNKKNRIALFAHWDTRPIADHDTKNQDKPILGANDGGSGVGLLLEIARQFSIREPKIGVDIILFDAEDYGQPEISKFPKIENSWCKGSQHWSKQAKKNNYFARYGVLVDMVAGENATFYQEEISNYFASFLVDKVWKIATTLGFGNHFVFIQSPQIIDDHYYVNTIASIPTIDIIEYDPKTSNNFNKHWHTHGDNMENINKNTMTAVGQTLLTLIYNE